MSRYCGRHIGERTKGELAEYLRRNLEGMKEVEAYGKRWNVLRANAARAKKELEGKGVVFPKA